MSAKKDDPRTPGDATQEPSLWRTEATERVLETPIFTVDKLKRTHPLRQTSAHFWSVSPPDWANILALTPQHELVLVQQYRHGTDRLTWEIPGGAVDPHEDALVGAQRELREETGYTATQWIQIGKIAVNPAFMSNHCTTWLALDATRTTTQDFDEHEELGVALIPVSAFFSKIDAGEIDHGIVVSAAYYLARYLNTHPLSIKDAT